MIEVDVALRRGTFRLEAAFSAEARVVALFGRSGAGKSTLVNAIAGLVRPERGRIVVDGRTLFDAGLGIDLPPEARRVGYVFQDALLFPHLSVAANLAYGERLTRAADRYIERDRVVSLLGLAPFLDRRPASLSGGERQRVAIGRALLASPRLLLLDEPLASLDAQRKGEILDYIERLRDELRVPVVYVSHAVEEVVRLADQVVVIASGRVAAQGSPVEALSRPGVAALASDDGEAAVLEARVAGRDKRYGLAILAFDGGELVVPDLGTAAGQSLRVRILARDVSLALERPTRVSIQNVLEARIESIGQTKDASVDVTLRVGASALISRITRKACEELALAPGSRVYAMVKAVSLERRA